MKKTYVPSVADNPPQLAEIYQMAKAAAKKAKMPLTDFLLIRILVEVKESESTIRAYSGQEEGVFPNGWDQMIEALRDY